MTIDIFCSFSEFNICKNGNNSSVTVIMSNHEIIAEITVSLIIFSQLLIITTVNGVVNVMLEDLPRIPLSIMQ